MSLKKNKQVTIAIIGEGEVFGEMGIVSEKPRSATVVAIDDLETTKITYNEFLELLTKNPDEGIKYLRVLFERMRESSSNMDIQKKLMDSAQSKDIPEALKSASADTVDESKTIKLIPLTSRAKKDLKIPEKKIKKLPFRIGRLSSRGRRDAMQFNDFSIIDERPYSVSRNHFSIEFIEGKFFIRDRGSRLGLVINDAVKIGGTSKESSFLINSTNTKILLGQEDSDEAFKYELVIS